MTTFRSIFLTLWWVLLTTAGAAHAEVYRWKDSAGVVHFGDRPTSTDPRAVQQVDVPPANVAEPFKARPAALPPAPASGNDGGDAKTQADNPAGPIDTANAPTRPLSGVAKRQASCAAQKSAFQASQACFAACGTDNGNLHGRNNARCGHCADLPTPHC
jgi:hypothetical protein